jgi:hypothetical protein
MIHSFTCENFYSVGEKVEVDFTVDGNAPSKSTYVAPTSSTRVSLIESVIGPNASGKTNLLKVLAFTQWLVVDAYSEDPDARLPIRPFGYNEKKPTSLSVVFSIDKVLYTYEFELSMQRILSERFSERTQSQERLTNKLLFSREWNSDKDDYDFTDKVFGVTREKLRKNSSVIATAYRDKNKLATIVARYWRDHVTTNVFEEGYRNLTREARNNIAHGAIAYFHNTPELMNMAQAVLRKFDIGFEEFAKHELQEKVFFGIKHKFGTDDFELPLEYESSGTKQAIVVLRYVLPAILSGGIAVIDELDANLHPELVEEIISLFSSPELNPKHAQIIFSSHTPTILSSLDKYQITFVEKNGSGQTEVWRLDSIRGVRADDNYYSKYIAGAYGAVPELG